MDYSCRSDIVYNADPDKGNKQTNDRNEATSITDGLEGAKGFHNLNRPV